MNINNFKLQCPPLVHTIGELNKTLYKFLLKNTIDKKEFINNLTKEGYVKYNGLYTNGKISFKLSKKGVELIIDRK